MQFVKKYDTEGDGKAKSIKDAKAKRKQKLEYQVSEVQKLIKEKDIKPS